jgi:gas vesicle protein
MSDNGKFGAFVTGFLTGVIAGGVASLLLAPQSGEETRKLIKEKSVEVYEKAEKNFEEAYAQAEASLAEAREKIEELAAQAKEKTVELQEKSHIMLENIAPAGKKTKVEEVVAEEAVEETPAEE